MNLNTLTIRIENTKASIQKTKKTLERHQQTAYKYKKQLEERGIDLTNMEATRRMLANSSRHEDYWLLCDYDNKLDDIQNNEKKLRELHEKLKDYVLQFDKESARQEVPHIPALEQFLAEWKAEAADWYRDQVNSLINFKADRKRTCEEIRSKYMPDDFLHRKEIAEDEKQAGVDYTSFTKEVKKRYGSDVLAFAAEGKPLEPRFEAKLEKVLSNEVVNKRLDLYHRCIAAVGVITDASNLHVGDNGSINGFIVGENGKAVLESVLAGGHTVQCLHFRVLVKPVREKESLTSKINRAQKKSSNSAKPESQHKSQDKDQSR